MALAFSIISNKKVANRTVKVVDVTWDASYPTGGEAITASNFGLKKIDFVSPSVALSSDRTTAVAVGWDRAASKLVAYETGGATGGVLAEKGSTESLASYVSTHEVIGF